MRVIFLDVDGVLNSQHSYKTQKMIDDMDDALIANLKKLVDAVGAEIVLSSSWRTPPEFETTWNLEKKLVDRLAFFKLTLFDRTPIRKDMVRGKEIKDWLKDHPEVTEFIIIDDDSSDIAVFTDLLPVFLHTNWKVGLTKKDVNTGIKMFNENLRLTRIESNAQGVDKIFFEIVDGEIKIGIVEGGSTEEYEDLIAYYTEKYDL